MKKGMVALVVACVLLVSNGATSFATDAPPTFNPPQHSYLALGDSLAFGYQAATFNQNFPDEPPTAFSTGYVDDVRHLTRCSIPLTERRSSEEMTSGSLSLPGGES